MEFSYHKSLSFLTKIKIPTLVILLLLFSTVSTRLLAKEEKAQAKIQNIKIDASDPTKIYTTIGVGPKYTDYTNSGSMLEMRVAGNLGLSKNDMLMFNVGYGKHSGNAVVGSDTGRTNIRARCFHLFDMDYSITSGYRG